MRSHRQKLRCRMKRLIYGFAEGVIGGEHFTSRMNRTSLGLRAATKTLLTPRMRNDENLSEGHNPVSLDLSMYVHS
jgi:hypothetical protein